MPHQHHVLTSQTPPESSQASKARMATGTAKSSRGRAVWPCQDFRHFEPIDGIIRKLVKARKRHVAVGIRARQADYLGVALPGETLRVS